MSPVKNVTYVSACSGFYPGGMSIGYNVQGQSQGATITITPTAMAKARQRLRLRQRGVFCLAVSSSSPGAPSGAPSGDLLALYSLLRGDGRTARFPPRLAMTVVNAASECKRGYPSLSAHPL